LLAGFLAAGIDIQTRSRCCSAFAVGSKRLEELFGPGRPDAGTAARTNAGRPIALDRAVGGAGEGLVAALDEKARERIRMPRSVPA